MRMRGVYRWFADLEAGEERLGTRDWRLGVEGAFDCQAAAVEDVGVDHGGTNILVTQ